MKFVTTDTLSQPESTIITGKFWPDINLAKLRDVMRIDPSVTTSRLEYVVINVINGVNRELKPWCDQQIQLGFSSLSEIPSDIEINGEHSLVLHYKHAIYSRTKSRLLEKFRDMDLTNTGNKKAQDMTETIDELNRDAHWALQAIQGKPNVTVGII